MLLAGVALAACRPSARAVDPEDPAITAIIDSLVNVALDGAARADAERVFQAAGGSGSDDDVSFMTGDVLLTGAQPIRQRFRETYAGLQHQEQTITEKRIRILSPDVAIACLVGEGTYTDKAGWTSDPVGLGMTLVFVKQDGHWRIRHAHQSIAP
jgi:uncharacterized protein (TIGR02246 family)